MLKLLKEYTEDFYRLFYPSLCGGCDTPLVKGEQHLCLHCLLSLPYTNFELMKDNLAERLFYGRVPIEFATSLLYFAKGEKVQQILHNIKYNEQRELAIHMGKILGQRLQNNPYLSDVNLLVPVPLHPQKEHVRGYNQSALLAEGIREVWNMEMAVNNLIRDVHTETQTRKSRVERWENVEKSFKVHHPERFRHKHILLIDDVLTTGATLEACAQTLLSAADCKVSIATLAFAVS